MKKLIVLATLLAVTASQAQVIRWGASTVGGGTGTTDWTDGNSWYDTGVGTGTAFGVPTVANASHALIGSEDGGVVVTTNVGSDVPNTIGIGWDTATGSMTIANGGSLIAGSNVYIGQGGGVVSSGVLTIETGGFMVAGTLHMAEGGAVGNNALVDMTGGLLHMGAIAIDPNGTGRFDLRNDALLLLNGNVAGLGFVGAYIFAPDAGTSIQEVYNATDDRTEWSVIPEPATFGLLALMGGGLLFVRRNFRN